MIQLSEIENLHLEFSTDCNARCPRCPRNYNGYPYNTGYIETHLTLEKVKALLPLPFVAQLKGILINGNYGDFVMNPESIDIISWFRTHNPSMVIDITTNGGARDKNFWKALAEFDPIILFCIDGLEDTHAIYRQNTVYETVIKNAQAFIAAGGRAVWLMTEFAHNLHQFEEATTRAKEMGFIQLNRRPSNRDTGPVYDKQGNKIFELGGVGNYMPNKIDDEYCKTHPYKMMEHYRTVGVACEAIGQKSLYISAEGTIDPCCHVGMNKSGMSWWQGDAALRQGQHPTDLAGGMAWFGRIYETFGTAQQLSVCSRTCGRGERI